MSPPDWPENKERGNHHARSHIQFIPILSPSARWKITSKPRKLYLSNSHSCGFSPKALFFFFFFFSLHAFPCMTERTIACMSCMEGNTTCTSSRGSSQRAGFSLHLESVLS